MSFKHAKKLTATGGGKPNVFKGGHSGASSFSMASNMDDTGSEGLQDSELIFGGDGSDSPSTSYSTATEGDFAIDPLAVKMITGAHAAAASSMEGQHDYSLTLEAGGHHSADAVTSMGLSPKHYTTMKNT